MQFPQITSFVRIQSQVVGKQSKMDELLADGIQRVSHAIRITLQIHWSSSEACRL